MSFWPRHNNAFPSILVGFAILGVILLATVIVAGITSNLFDDLTNPWFTLTTYALTFGLSLWVLLRIKVEKHHFYFTRVPAGIYILLIIPTIALVFLREPLINLMTDIIPLSDDFAELVAPLLDFHPALFVTIALLAPLLEELIFRGVILDGFLKRYDPWKAILWSSFFFAVAHFNPWQFVSAFALGILIGWLYWKTRSLWPGIFVHFLNNAGAYIAAAFLGPDQIDLGTEEMMGPAAYSFLLFFSLFIAILFIHWIGVFFNRRPVFWENREEEASSVDPGEQR
jgi:uncharacterized protein